MDDRVEVAVNEARKKLGERSRDAGHDLKHHQTVWENAHLIVKEENLDVDLGLLKVACFWHDVVLKNGASSKDNILEVAEYLKEYLPGIGFKQRDVETIVETIRYHEFGSSPVNIEGKVLQDADKMDVASFERGVRTYESYKEGKMTREEIVNRGETFLNWVPQLLSSFHFPISRKITAERLCRFLKDETTKNIFEEIGLGKEYHRALREFEVSQREGGERKE
jgi:hypothetical protein